MPLELTRKPKFDFDEIVRHKITKRKGLILNVTYESPEFLIYTVNYGNDIDRAKEGELMTEEDYQTTKLFEDED